MPNCYYYDEQRNHCKCYVNENLNELLAENAKLRDQGARLFDKTLELGTENVELLNLVRDIYDEYRYLRMRFHRTYVQHEERMRVIEQRMRKLGAEVDDDREA